MATSNLSIMQTVQNMIITDKIIIKIIRMVEMTRIGVVGVEMLEEILQSLVALTIRITTGIMYLIITHIR